MGRTRRSSWEAQLARLLREPGAAARHAQGPTGQSMIAGPLAVIIQGDEGSTTVTKGVTAELPKLIVRVRFSSPAPCAKKTRTGRRRGRWGSAARPERPPRYVPRVQLSVAGGSRGWCTPRPGAAIAAASPGAGGTALGVARRLRPRHTRPGTARGTPQGGCAGSRLGHRGRCRMPDVQSLSRSMSSCAGRRG